MITTIKVASVEYFSRVLTLTLTIITRMNYVKRQKISCWRPSTAESVGKICE